MSAVMKRHKEKAWQPLVRLRPDQTFRRPEIVEETAKHYGINLDEAAEMLDREEAKCAYFINNLYQVQLSFTHIDWFGEQKELGMLNVRRRDGAMIWDWRHFQEIKNQLLGPEVEGMQLFPAESRKVDTSNKFSIWVLTDGTRFPFGWQTREVLDANPKYRGVPGLRQRPL
jgi:hypothetical protein